MAIHLRPRRRRLQRQPTGAQATSPLPKLPTLFTALFLVAGTLATAQTQADIYVSPSGNDDGRDGWPPQMRITKTGRSQPLRAPSVRYAR